MTRASLMGDLATLVNVIPDDRYGDDAAAAAERLQQFIDHHAEEH
jgi:hypothetical protein